MLWVERIDVYRCARVRERGENCSYIYVGFSVRIACTDRCVKDCLLRKPKIKVTNYVLAPVQTVNFFSLDGASKHSNDL